jgi:CHAD domain-containing protein
MARAVKQTRSDGSPDVLKHLARSIHAGWRRYRKRLKRCQEGFSEEAVHDSRVETRRLISSIELAGAFVSKPAIQEARRALKGHLDTFDQLRDTQVQLDYIQRIERTFPTAKPFRSWLVKREVRFTRKARKAVERIRTRRTERRVAGLEKDIRRLHNQAGRDEAFKTVQDAMNRAFARVARLCRHVQAEDTATIHRTRIAFKHFRYMVEALSPLLPSLTEEHRRAMHGYQSMMGDIQDVEVLIAAFEKFLARGKGDARSTARLHAELLRRREWLVRVYVNAAGKLRQFWPPPGPATAARPGQHQSQ